jgi:microcystin-dependent protein
MTSYCRAPLSFSAHARPTVGDTKTSAVARDHIGWLRCDGRALNVADFYMLFQVIGYSFGGSGTTFNLPNTGGRIPGFVGTGVDSNANTFTIGLGTLAGEYEHRLTIAEMPTHNHTGTTDLSGTHTHTIADPGHTHSLPLASAALVGTGPADDVTQGSDYDTGSNTTGITINNAGIHAHTFTTADRGGSNYHNNMPPIIGVGSMFIYSGKPNYPLTGFPYAAGTNLL